MFPDDICHLAPYAINNVLAKHDTELTRYFAERKMAVDFLHFKVKILLFSNATMGKVSYLF